MADRYWVGTDSNWHSASNWSLTSGGAGGAGVPTASDDVYIDGGGYVLCWATTPFVCNDFTILTGSTELCLFDQGGVINGDFEMQDGYFGPTGGGGYTVEFKGDYLNTGGTFAVGTGTGVDPTCEFSGSGKTYQHDNSGSASYQHMVFSGSYTVSGTRLAVANVSQDFSVSGSVTFTDTNAFVLTGEWVGMTGSITSTGGSPYISYEVDSTKSMTTDSGTIGVRVELLVQDDFILPARTWDGDFYLEYQADQKVFTLGAGKHRFNGVFEIFADDPSITTSAELECSTYDAEFRCLGQWSIDSSAFTQPSQFILRWGDGVHVFKDNLRLGLFGGATLMLHDAGESTIILHATKNLIYQHRLSRRTSGWPSTMDELTWNKIYILRVRGDASPSIRFIEGFTCSELRFEIYDNGSFSVTLRNRNIVPQQDTTADKLVLTGTDGTKLMIGYPVVTGLAWHARVAVNEVEIYSVTIAKMKSASGTLDTYNSELWSGDGGQTSGFTFYDREERQIGCLDSLNSGSVIGSEPPPELIVERLMESAA